MKKMIILILSVYVVCCSAFADEPTPNCVQGTNVVNGEQVVICGIVNVGGTCYQGTNVTSGEIALVCGAIPL